MAWDIWMLPPFALLGSYGRRYGPTQLSLGAGAASIYCRCPEGQGTLQLPVSAAVELSGGRAGRPAIYGLKLAYDLVPVVGVGSAAWVLRHGGHIELKVGIATGMGRHGLPSGAEAGTWTIGALAAYWPTIAGEAPMRFLGLTVGWQFPL
jgi:hypothetical protein